MRTKRDPKSTETTPIEITLTVTVTLTADQIAALAAAVASKLAAPGGRTRAYTIAELASGLGVSKETVRNRIHAGQIPRVPGIGAIRVPAAAARALIEDKPK